MNRFCRFAGVLRLFFFLSAAFASIALANGPIPPPQVEWMPGELVVKLRESRSMMSLDRRGSLATLHAELGVSSVEPLYSVREDWLRLRFDPTQDVNAIAARYRELAEVELAEPNYIFRLVGDSGARLPARASTSIRSIRPSLTPDDPMFPSQWGLTYIQAPQAWDITQGSPSQVIAVIDTGVDLDHPDLASKIWTNPNEVVGDKNNDNCPGFCGVDDDGDGLIDEDGAGRQPGASGYDASFKADDDENGYIDDFRGWDFVGTGSGIPDNDPQDDNGHGSHVAGIAAAATNNGIGIAGVCPQCRIMPLKAFLANGSGTSSDIAKAIEYAQKNGATVISMSFSSPADSAVVRDALSAAYPKAVLVAAAGNDRSSRATALCAATGVEYPIQPSYPGAYSFVLGVEASDQAGAMASFSNCGYAVRAPGVGMISTLFDNSYATWSGTSMAAPVVAGVAGLLRTQKALDPAWTTGALFAQIQQGGANAFRALTLGPQPRMQFVTATVTDPLDASCSSCNNDGKIQPGETVKIEVTVHNGGATQAFNVTGTLSTSSLNATVFNATTSWGAVGPNADQINTTTPFRVTLGANAANNEQIPLTLTVTCSNGDGQSGFVQTVDVTVSSGVVKAGVISANETWTAGKRYLITAGSVLIPAGVTVTIEPGATIEFGDLHYIQVDGELRARGTIANRIQFVTSDDVAFGGFQFSQDSGSAPTFDSNGNYVSGSILEYGRFDGSIWVSNYVYVARNIFRNSIGSIQVSSNLEKNLFTAFGGPYTLIPSQTSPPAQSVRFNTIVGNSGDGVEIGYCFSQVSFSNNNLFQNQGFDFNIGSCGGDYIATNNYWGTTDSSIIRSHIPDCHTRCTNCQGFDCSVGSVTYEPFLSSPEPNAPVVVSTIQLSTASPIGAQRVTFTVTFSRPMDITVQPKLYFGPQIPYTQRAVTLNARWIDSTHWVADYNVTKFTGDGLQKFVVTNAQDTEGFPLPSGDYRFGFQIATSGTSSLSLQASGAAGRVNLTWTAADLTVTPTFAGFNVYRSSTSGGPYEKLNGPLISTNSYADMTAAPSSTYYYVYREVDTDNNEGPDSNEAAASALDAVPPTIAHTPRTTAPVGVPITIVANITDDAATPTATLHYRARNSATTYAAVNMLSAAPPQFTANIPTSAANPPGVEYYIEATDGTNISRSGSSTAPHVIIIGSIAKGDINGDGALTASDVIYLVNYMFAAGNTPVGSADLNGDGSVTVADLFYLINHLFAGGPTPQ